MASASFTTPFGRLDLSCRAGSARATGSAETVRTARPDGHVLGWLFPEFEAELLLAPITSPLPPGMTISASHTALWRLRALADIGPCVFDAIWAPGASVPDGGPDSGQALNAMTWGNESVELSLGAPDAEALIRYQDLGLRMPRSWRTLLKTEDLSTVHIEDYFADGLSLRLPVLSPGETAHIHFAVAWTDQPTDDPATWFAVDIGTATLRSLLDRMSNDR